MDDNSKMREEKHNLYLQINTHGLIIGQWHELGHEPYITYAEIFSSLQCEELLYLTKN